MTNYVNRCMIVPAAYAPLARALCAGMTPGDSGSGMFAAGLSATGNAPATHYISSGMIYDTFADLLPLKSFDAEGKATTIPGQPATIVTLAEGVVTLAQVNGLLAAVDVTEQGPHTAIARMGLQQVRMALP